MPTVLREDGYDVQIFTQDHLPPHVHVFARGCELIVDLNLSEADVEVRDNFRFKNSEARRIVSIVQNHRAMLAEAWEEIHADL